MSLADFSPLANHLWQSTLFVAVVWLLTFLLRSNRAQVRYWLWLAASMKFLMPFAAVVAIGRQVGWQSFPSIAQPEVTFVIDAIGQPFSRPELTAVNSLLTTSPSFTALFPILLLAIWFGGCVMHLLAWGVRWRRLAAVVRDASPLENGREWDTLRRLERVVGIRRAVTLASSDSSLEPGIFGILKPVLLWPRGISQRLSDHQVAALLTHELCHIRRRDNLAAALHMIVEAVFWFHPLVWWIEKRLIDERERACDEEVIQLGSDPELYAESILKTCELYAESPLVCVSGVTGSDLKKRVEAIMRGGGGEKLNAWKTLLLATVGIVTIATPVVIGALNAPLLRAQAPPAVGSSLTFEVASIKPNKSDDGRVMMQSPGGRLNITNAPLRLLIRLAYRVQDFQIVGGPSWLNSDHFDVAAKAEGNPSQEQLTVMLRALLADRFKLAMHNENRELPVYSLVLARNDRALGPKIRQTALDCAALRKGPPPDPAKPSPCGFRVGLGTMAAQGVGMNALASNLSNSVGRVVLDRTGLSGDFDFDLLWAPDPLSGSASPAASPLPPIDPNAPSIFTALQEQLGLKLESARGPVDVLVIDSVQQPTSDEIGLTTDQPPLLAAQSSATNVASPTFEVASIKPNKSGELRTTIQGMQPGGRFTAANMTLRMLIRMAYRLQEFQLSGGPKWIDSDRFDIVAKADRDYTPAQLPMMMQTLLAERFKLAVHNESRDLRVYALVVASRDGKLGPRIHSSDVDCAALLASGALPPLERGKVPPCATETSGGRHMIANGMTMSQLAGALSISAKGIVVDQTGLSGAFDLELEWTPESPTPALTDAAGASDRPADSGPSIFTAVQEQLGLKLDAQRGPVDVTIIDSVEQPTPD